MFFKLQPLLIIAAIGSLIGFCTMTGVDTLVAKIMIGLALSLVLAIFVTGFWDHPYKDSIPHV
jgi:uncharacterized membrane protein YtjA (UPF0391 family)